MPQDAGETPILQQTGETPMPKDAGETPALQAGMTPEQLAEAKQYGRYSLACTLADKVLDLLFLTFAAVVLARPLDAWLQQARRCWGGSRPCG